jgi:hypothetical protein
VSLAKEGTATYFLATEKAMAKEDGDLLELGRAVGDST